ncbi:Scr1 family TA system antitoxin-like transcriptional regulator [Nocardia jinanensis]|uniref:DUF5753 domain-containing protein n=1 Tax=Nocardia jinanensis TaxID=382504 RepID=A0A917RN98_9NOCA|nr:Scr1 family TA system antitoxin-like transcriptional regulator [Nocardia jinanensis]GGL16781.1 hypothetical protein GCM10011588_34330 [Nocardia jinanensis]
MPGNDGVLEIPHPLLTFLEPGTCLGVLLQDMRWFSISTTTHRRTSNPGRPPASNVNRFCTGGNHRFYFLIAEQVLHTHVGDPNVMVEQLDRLLTAMSLPRVVLGIVPAGAEYRTPVMNDFIMFDIRMVQVETISAELTITQPSEIAVYGKAFHTLTSQAIHGQAARAMITAAMNGSALYP